MLGPLLTIEAGGILSRPAPCRRSERQEALQKARRRSTKQRGSRQGLETCVVARNCCLCAREAPATQWFATCRRHTQPHVVCQGAQARLVRRRLHTLQARAARIGDQGKRAQPTRVLEPRDVEHAFMAASLGRPRLAGRTKPPESYGKVDRHTLPKVTPNDPGEVHNCQKLPQSCPTIDDCVSWEPRSGPNSTNIGRCGPILGRAGPNLTGSSQLSAQID